jgi:hypothetical protein
MLFSIKINYNFCYKNKIIMKQGPFVGSKLLDKRWKNKD